MHEIIINKLEDILFWGNPKILKFIAKIFLKLL